MRRRLGMLLAAVTGVLIVLAAVLVALVQEPGPALPPPTGDGAQLALGRRVYEEQRCHRCHSIAGAGNSRYPLDGVGSRESAQAIRTWITAPTAMDPSVRKPAFAGLPADDLEALVAYLRTLRTPSP